MPTSAVVSVTIQAAGFSVASTLLAQFIAMYQAQRLTSIDPISLLQFMLIAIIVTPPNYAYQKWLEDTFPARPEGVIESDKKFDGEKTTQGKLSISNTVCKFVLDQSIGAVANTVMFIALVNLFKGNGVETIVGEVQRDMWSMIKAGWSFWPVVCLSNLIIVPFEHRAMVGNISGLLWGTYVNLSMM